MSTSVITAAAEALAIQSPTHKVAHTQATYQAWQQGMLTLDRAPWPTVTDEPGRPAQPKLVHPRKLQKRSLHNAAGRVVLVHALAHIEFNAINLALDAMCRFSGLPETFYSDWLRVASEEAQHFNLLRERLRHLDHDYGDFPAHDGLWDMARRTAHDPLARMALVPRVLEARGLDVTPSMIETLTAVGDTDTVAILRIILRDEIEHVAIGSRWFKALCVQRQLEPQATFRQLVSEYFNGQLRGPFNHQARQQAGFSPAELIELGANGS